MRRLSRTCIAINEWKYEEYNVAGGDLSITKSVRTPKMYDVMFVLRFSISRYIQGFYKIIGSEVLDDW